MNTSNQLPTISRRTRSLLVLAALALLALGLGACNTVRGVGEDVSAMGQSVADTAARSGG